MPNAENKGMGAWLRAAKRPEVVRRSSKVAILVGTILTLINHGDLLFNGMISPDMIWQIPLTYCVPYCVSTYAAVDALMSGR